MGAKGMVFRGWAHEQAPLSSQWQFTLIFSIVVWLERAELLITAYLECL